MSLESATFISDLVASNPASSDQRKQGDDHLRLIKTTLQSTFPDANRAIRFGGISSKSANYSALVGDDKSVIVVDTSGGSVTVTLPATGTLTAPWLATIVKGTTDANPVFVAPAAGTINGFAKIRCNRPYTEYRFLWTGAIWIRLQSPGEVPAGTLEDYIGDATYPVGYAFAYGQEISRADHPELFAAWGGRHGTGDGSTTFNAPDARGRTTAGLDNMGGVAAERLTTDFFGVFYNVLGGIGGAESHTLTEAQLAAHTHSVTDPGHTHSLSDEKLQAAGITVTAGGGYSPVETAETSGSSTTGITISSTGGGNAHNNVQPTILTNKMFRLC